MVITVAMIMTSTLMYGYLHYVRKWPLWLVLPVMFVSARLFGLARRGALLAAGMGSLLWFFDSFSHWCWWVGMVAYAFASYLCLLPLALFYRWLQDRRSWQAVAAALSLGLVHLVHPYSFFILAAPMLALWAYHWRRLGPRGHLAVLGIAATTVAMNAWPSWMSWLGWSSLVRKSGSIIENAGSVPALASLRN